MALIGCAVSGFCGAAWLQHLEANLGSSTDTASVLRKTAADYLCWAPVANSAYLFFIPLLSGNGFEASLAGLQYLLHAGAEAAVSEGAAVNKCAELVAKVTVSSLYHQCTITVPSLHHDRTITAPSRGGWPSHAGSFTRR